VIAFELYHENNIMKPLGMRHKLVRIFFYISCSPGSLVWTRWNPPPL